MAQENWGGTFTADIDTLTRLATSAPFARYLQEQIFEQSLFIKSGVLVRSSLLSDTTGVRVEAPFFSPIDPVEERMDSSSTWGTSGAGYFTYQKFASKTQFATITHRGFAYGVDKLSRLATGEDALEVLGRQLAQAIDKKRTAKAFAHLEGLLGAGGPLNSTSSLNKSVTTGAGQANYLTAENVIEARYKLNERQGTITTLVIHSSVAAYLEQLALITYDGDRRGINKRLIIGSAYNVNIIVDDQVPVIGTTGQQRQFVCYLLGDGVMAEGDQVPLEIEPERNAASKQTGLVIDYHQALHVMGTSWAANFDNPTNAQLATGSNFSLSYSNYRLIPAVRLIVNSPYGGII